MNLNNKGTVLLETERLILRRLTIKDAKPMFDNWANDKEVTRFLTWVAHSDIGVTKSVIRSWIKDYKKKDFYTWGIELKSTGELIGTMGVHNIADIKFQCEVGYCIGKKWWKQGFTTEALRRVRDFLFDEINFYRIMGFHFKDNPNSGKVMKSIGMSYVATIKGAVARDAGRVYFDEEMYYMLKTDKRQ